MNSKHCIVAALIGVAIGYYFSLSIYGVIGNQFAPMGTNSVAPTQ